MQRGSPISISVSHLLVDLILNLFLPVFIDIDPFKRRLLQTFPDDGMGNQCRNVETIIIKKKRFLIKINCFHYQYFEVLLSLFLVLS